MVYVQIHYFYKYIKNIYVPHTQGHIHIYTVKAIRFSDGLFYCYNSNRSTMDYTIKFIQSKNGDYVRVYITLAGGHIDLHPMHGNEELKENMEACMILADHGFTIELLPMLHAEEIALRKKFLPDVFCNKNPDVRINGQLIGDIKTPDKDLPITKSTISRLILSAAKQKADIAILNLYERDYSFQDIKRGTVGALQPDRNRSILLVWVITKNRNLFTISRQMVFNDSVYERLIHL